MTINVKIYNDKGVWVSSRYIRADNLEKLLIQLDEISEDGKYTYQIYDGDNHIARPIKG